MLRRANNEIHIEEGRDVWWHRELEYVDANCPAEPLDSEHPLFILYTSGSTGKPKGILHTTGGYLLGKLIRRKYVFDLRDDDVYWCTADIGWVTGHSYVVYGPLANGATSFMYEGAPNWPEPDRFWRIIDEYGVTILYTAPTAIRAFMRWGDKWIEEARSLSSLRLLGTVGEPINPEAWIWYHEVIGGETLPDCRHLVADRNRRHHDHAAAGRDSDQTRHRHAAVFRRRCRPSWTTRARKCRPNVGGKLVIRKPWPACCAASRRSSRVTKNNTGAKSKADISPATARVGTRTVISGSSAGSTTCSTSRATASAPPKSKARWSAIRKSPKPPSVGRPDELKGQGLVVFVTLKGGVKPTPSLSEELRDHVGKEIGAIAKPDDMRFAEALPKTRSGKIMRRLLKEIAGGKTITGDTTTLEDFSVLAKLSSGEE